MSAIIIVNGKKSYGTVEALKGIDLTVGKGEFFGLLGPNGAGKTTLIRAIVGLCRLGAGSISVHGHDIRREFLKTHALVGYAPQELNLDRFFSIQKILMYQAGFYGFDKKKQKEIVGSLLNQFHLEEKAHLTYYRLSGGMQKRLLIAKAMVGLPKVLILDEPTAGVDVEQRHELWTYLRGLNKGGTTIILTTHYIDEAEALCGRIGIIHLGEIREIGQPLELIDRYCEKKVVVSLSKKLPEESFSTADFSAANNGSMLVLSGRNVGVIFEKFRRILSEYPDCHILDLHVERGSLEDVFIKITGSRIEKGKEEDHEPCRISDIG